MFFSTPALALSVGDEGVVHLARRAGSLLSEREIVASTSPLTRSLRTDAAARVRLAKTRAARKAKRDVMVAALDKRATPAQVREKLLKTKAVAAKKAAEKAKKALAKAEAAKTKAAKAKAAKHSASVKAASVKAQSSSVKAASESVAAQSASALAAIVSVSAASASQAASIQSASAKSAAAAPASTQPAVVPASASTADAPASTGASSGAKAFGGGSLSAYATYTGTKCHRDKNCASAQVSAQLPTNGVAVCDQTSRHCTISCAGNYLLNGSGMCIPGAVTCPTITHGTYSLDSAGVCQPACNTLLGYALTVVDGVNKCINTSSGVSNCGGVGNACPPSYNGIGFAKCFFGGCTLECPQSFYVYYTTTTTTPQPYCQ